MFNKTIVSLRECDYESLQKPAKSQANLIGSYILNIPATSHPTFKTFKREELANQIGKFFEVEVGILL
jgi:hypothetical protein